MVALSLEEYSDDPDDSDDNISVFSGYAQVTWSFSEIRNSEDFRGILRPEEQALIPRSILEGPSLPDDLDAVSWGSNEEHVIDESEVISNEEPINNLAEVLTGPFSPFDYPDSDYWASSEGSDCSEDQAVEEKVLTDEDTPCDGDEEDEEEVSYLFTWSEVFMKILTMKMMKSQEARVHPVRPLVPHLPVLQGQTQDQIRTRKKLLRPLVKCMKQEKAGKDSHQNYAEPVRQKKKNVKESTKNKNLPLLEEPFDYDLLEHLAHVPARISLYDLLRLSPEIRKSVITALSDPEKYAPHVHRVEMKKKGQNKVCEVCQSTRGKLASTITFTKEEMLLGDMKHNRPLYFTAYIGEIKLPRVQIDPGSAANLLPLRTLSHLGIPTSKLSHTRVTIQGYNGEYQKAIGNIRLKCQIGELKTEIRGGLGCFL